MQWSKDDKTNMQKDLVGFVKASKQNETRRTSCLTRVTKYWEIKGRDRFARFNYPCSSPTVYRKVITVVRLATTLLRRNIAIRKLKNNIINWLTNPQPSMLPQKWQFNTSQDCEVLGDEFDSVSLETILNATLQALGFHHSPLGYLKEGTPRFADIIDKLELRIKLENDISQSHSPWMRRRGKS